MAKTMANLPKLVSPLLQVQNLHVAYVSRAGQKSPALAGLSFEMQPGETLGVLGESGSGKSTLAAALLRLLPANGKIESGAVLFEGLDLLQAEPGALQRIRGARIAVIFQEPSLALHPLIRIVDQVKDGLPVSQSSTLGLTRREPLQLLRE